MPPEGRHATGRPPKPDYVIRIGGAAALPPVLKECGVDPGPLLRAAGLNERVFDHPDNVVPFAALCRALQLAVQRAGIGDIGLRAGMRADLRSLGILGYVVANADTVGRGLAALSESLHVHDQGAVPFLLVDDGIAMLGYQVLDPGIGGAEQMTHGALAIAANALRGLCGPDFELRGVTFSSRAPADTSLFRSFFAAPVRFDAERNALAFDARWLARPVKGADAYLREILSARLTDGAAGRREAFEDRIRRVVRTLLAAGLSSEAETARAIGIGRSTLARRLKASGTSFRAVVDEAKFDAARIQLESSRVAIVEIAAGLGYADVSSFTRAFRRWSGSSPAQWRRRHGG